MIFKMRYFLFFILSFFLVGSLSQADPIIPITAPMASQPTIIPLPPSVNAKAYLLMDAHSGRILARSEGDTINERLAPASLTKMMTSYVISKALQDGQIHFTDPVLISESAWKTGGSKMFVKVGDKVSLKDLMQGIIVDSGNDACVAMAEHVAGSQESFVNMMNQQAAVLGMKNTHFVDVDGLPDPNHYTTAYDMALLARALIFNFPDHYKWYSQKWFFYNGIKQANRNRLLWRDPDIDGIKTGHTDEAGYCLVASAQKNGMRLISVVMGAPSEKLRTEDSQKLLTYGFRFFESRKLYSAGKVLATAPILFGNRSRVKVGLAQDLYVTLPMGKNKAPFSTMIFNPNLRAPIKKGDSVGELNVVLSDKSIISVPLISLESVSRGGVLSNLMSHLRVLFNKI